MKIFLVLPPSGLEAFGSNFEQDYATMAGHGYISALLKNKGHIVKSLDCIAKKISYNKSLENIHDFNPDVIGISCLFTPQDSIKYSNFLVNHGVKALIATFGEASLNYQYILEEATGIDFVIIGEPENTFIDIVKYVDNGIKGADICGVAYLQDDIIVATKPRKSIDNLDTIGFPNFEYSRETSRNRYYILSSKGCYGNCTFCRTQVFNNLTKGKRWRYKTPKQVVDEIEIVNKSYGITRFSFYDQDFFGGGSKRGRRRAIEIADEILERNLHIQFSFLCRPDEVDYALFKQLKAAGLDMVFIGLESGSQSVLDRLKKNISVEINEKAIKTLNVLKIQFQAGWMMYEPRITLDEIKENLHFIERTKLYNSIWFSVSIFNDLRIYNLTPIFHEFVKKNGKNSEEIYNVFEYPFHYENKYINILLGGMFNLHHLVKRDMAIISYCLNKSYLIVKQQYRLHEWFNYIEKLKYFERDLGKFVFENFKLSVEILERRLKKSKSHLKESEYQELITEINSKLLSRFSNFEYQYFLKSGQEFLNEILEFLRKGNLISDKDISSFMENLHLNI